MFVWSSKCSDSHILGFKQLLSMYQSEVGRKRKLASLRLPKHQVAHDNHQKRTEEVTLRQSSQSVKLRASSMHELWLPIPTTGIFIPWNNYDFNLC